MKPIYIAFGANLSNPKETFSKAVSALANRGVRVAQMSSLWQSPAWPAGSGAPDYVNACAMVEFDGTPEALMHILLDVETALGRVRSERNAPRVIDLDLLLWGDLELRTTHLTLPHPRMFDRPFVLLPLMDISPEGDWMDHLAKLPMADVLALRRIEAPSAKSLLQSRA